MSFWVTGVQVVIGRPRRSSCFAASLRQLAFALHGAKKCNKQLAFFQKKKKKNSRERLLNSHKCSFLNGQCLFMYPYYHCWHFSKNISVMLSPVAKKLSVKSPEWIIDPSYFIFFLLFICYELLPPRMAFFHYWFLVLVGISLTWPELGCSGHYLRCSTKMGLWHSPWTLQKWDFLQATCARLLEIHTLVHLSLWEHLV